MTILERPPARVDRKAFGFGRNQRGKLEDMMEHRKPVKDGALAQT